jgi:hypothetical protein
MNMSETLIDQGTSEDHARVPAWKELIKLVIAVVSAGLALLPVWLTIVPLWLVLGALSYYASPGTMQNLAEAALITVSAVLYLGGAAVLGVSVQFVILGIPTAILGWRFRRITPLSSTIVGLLIGFIPRLLILPFDQSFGPNYPSTGQQILNVAGETLVMGVLGAFNGYLFWFVWWLLTRRSVPKKQTPNLG